MWAKLHECTPASTQVEFLRNPALGGAGCVPAYRCFTHPEWGDSTKLSLAEFIESASSNPVLYDDTGAWEWRCEVDTVVPPLYVVYGPNDEHRRLLSNGIIDTTCVWQRHECPVVVRGSWPPHAVADLFRPIRWIERPPLRIYKPHDHDDSVVVYEITGNGHVERLVEVKR